MDSGRKKEEKFGADGRLGGCWRAEQHKRGGAEIRSQNKDRTGAELSAGRQLEVKDPVMHIRGMVERNAGRAGDRGLVNAKRLVRREELHSIWMNDVAQDRVMDKVRAERIGEHDEGAQWDGGQTKGQSRVEGMTRGRNRVGGQGRATYGRARHGIARLGRGRGRGRARDSGRGRGRGRARQGRTGKRGNDNVACKQWPWRDW